MISTFMFAKIEFGDSAVARKAWRVINKRQAPSYQLVEQGGFADIGSAKNGDGIGHVLKLNSGLRVLHYL